MRVIDKRLRKLENQFGFDTRERVLGNVGLSVTLEKTCRSNLAGCGQGHDGVYFTKNQVDAVRDTWHDCASGYRDEAGHEGIFNKILAAMVLPNSSFND